MGKRGLIGLAERRSREAEELTRKVMTDRGGRDDGELRLRLFFGRL